MYFTNYPLTFCAWFSCALRQCHWYEMLNVVGNIGYCPITTITADSRGNGVGLGHMHRSCWYISTSRALVFAIDSLCYLQYTCINSNAKPCVIATGWEHITDIEISYLVIFQSRITKAVLNRTVVLLSNGSHKHHTTGDNRLCTALWLSKIVANWFLYVCHIIFHAFIPCTFS